MKFITDKEQIKPGLIIFRRGDVGHDQFYCRIRIGKEDRYKTISLKTSDRQTARDRAMDQDADIRWRAVQAQRIVIPIMRDSARAVTGASKAFYGNARWLVLAAIFNRLKPEMGEALELTADEQAAISAAVTDYAEKLLALCVAKGFASYELAAGGVQVLQSTRDFQSVFKTQGDCQNLFGALKAEIWKTTNEAQPNGAEQQGAND